ncbi:hypothetical protein Tco_1292558 [Tanacetum coccineum]
MVENVVHLFVGLKLEKHNSPDQRLLTRLRRRFSRLGPLNLKLEIRLCSRSRPGRKCLSDDTLVIPLEEIQLDDKLNFVEEPVEVMDREVKQLKRSRIPIVKVRWNARRGPEYTWEREDQFKSKYPHLFATSQSPTTS